MNVVMVDRERSVRAVSTALGRLYIGEIEPAITTDGSSAVRL